MSVILKKKMPWNIWNIVITMKHLQINQNLALNNPWGVDMQFNQLKTHMHTHIYTHIYIEEIQFVVVKPSNKITPFTSIRKKMLILCLPLLCVVP